VSNSVLKPVCYQLRSSVHDLEGQPSDDVQDAAEIAAELVRTPAMGITAKRLPPGRLRSPTSTTSTPTFRGRRRSGRPGAGRCRRCRRTPASALCSTETRGCSTTLKVCRPSIGARTLTSRYASNSTRKLQMDCSGTSAVTTGIPTSV